MARTVSVNVLMATMATQILSNAWFLQTVRATISLITRQWHAFPFVWAVSEMNWRILACWLVPTSPDNFTTQTQSQGNAALHAPTTPAFSSLKMISTKPVSRSAVLDSSLILLRSTALPSAQITTTQTTPAGHACRPAQPPLPSSVRAILTPAWRSVWM